jgi:signal transduction histidine kinase
MSPQRRFSFRPSILVEILAALGVVLIVSTVLSSIFEARLVNAALRRQSRELAASRLAILAAEYRDRERLLDITLRTIAERVDAENLTLPTRRHQLIAELGRTGNSLQMDLLQMVGPDETQVSATARELERSELERVREIEASGESGPVRMQDGRSVQALAVPIGVTGYLVVGGYEFSDAFAYQMREKIGDEGQLILVANGRVVGSTLPRAPQTIPGKPENSDALPSAPMPLPGGDDQRVAYVSIGASDRPTTEAALGVILPDPVASLNSSITSVRISSGLFLTVVALVLGWVLFRRVTRPLVGLSKTAGRIAEGEFDADFTAPRKDEIGKLAESLQLMTGELQAKTRRLQEASKRLVGAQEQERRRVARDLHDGMQQQLVALAIKLRHAASGKETLASGSLSSLADDAEDAAFALQELGRGISPTVLADQGLHAALRGAAGRLPMKVVLEVEPGLEDARFGPDIEGTLYYVALEAMANAQKHAPESVLTIALSLGVRELMLKIADNGPGFDIASAQAGQGAGLQNMQDRINAQGGKIMILSRIGAGTTIVCSIPLPERASADGGALPEVDEDSGHPPVEVGLL